MSRHTSSDFLAKPRYHQQHVGGSVRPMNNSQYIKNQEEILVDNDIALMPSLRQNKNDTQIYKIRPKKEDRYDPYDNFLLMKGLYDDGSNRRRFQTTYLSINSSNRTILPTAITDTSYILDSNPIKFTNNSSTLSFKLHPNPFVTGDLVQITNVVGVSGILRTYNDSGAATFEIPKNCNFMKIYFKHGVPITYNDSYIEVDIAGVRGDVGSVSTSSYLGNIPINVINTRHQIIIDPLNSSLIEIPEDCIIALGASYFNPSPNYFFVALPIVMQNVTPPYLLQEYNFTVDVLALNGIPINLINSKYPIEPTNLQGYQVVTNYTQSSFDIELKIKALSTGLSGGRSVTITRVSSVNPGYPNPNNYIIDLGQTFHDVISARLVSSEFPNSDTAINSSNNKLYWNDLDDGDYLYSITVPPGNYTPGELAPVLQDLFFNTPRVNANTSNFTYNSTHFIKVTINSNTNEVTFESYKQFNVIQPIIEISPDIVLDVNEADTNAEANTDYTLTIYNPGHGMINPGQTILIQGAIATKGIPADVINTTHTVTKIIDANSYQFVLKKGTFNLLTVRKDTKGGAAVSILIPSEFRLRFDQPDTLGTVLGFRDPGNVNSVYAFDTVISNSDPYQFEIAINSLGNNTPITNNSINLSGNNYIIMTAYPLDSFCDDGNIKKAFAKIQLCDSPGKVLFNSYVSTPKHYEDPLNELSTIQVTFYDPSGNLYDFNGLDHSYTIEIVTVNDIPEGTGISSNTGRNYNLKV